MTQPGPDPRFNAPHGQPPQGWYPPQQPPAPPPGQPPSFSYPPSGPMPPMPPNGGWHQPPPGPPPPSDGNTGLIVALVAVLIVAAVLVGYVLWPKGEQTAEPPAASPSQSPSAPASPAISEEPPSPSATSAPSTATGTTVPPATNAPASGEAPPVVPSDLPTVNPDIPAATPTEAGPDPLNPGYDPEKGRGGFKEPRAERPPIEAPDATPAQEWPTIADPGPWTGSWQQVVGERGRYAVPADWVVDIDVLRGYDTMAKTLIVRDSSVFGKDQCQGEDLAFVGTMKPIEGKRQDALAEFMASSWSLLINTQWEGDYYLVPEPVTMEFPFADGVKGYLSTVTFVPKHPGECDFPAMRVSVVTRSGGDPSQIAVMVMVSRVGKEGELGLTLERQILSSYVPN